MSLHNQDSQHVTNKASSSLYVNQSAAGASSMAKQIAKSAAPSNSNKYSTLNINNQFKGKGIEPQHKTTVLRAPSTGMQTLGKPVAARRMPPPSNLPSLRTFNSSPTQSGDTGSNENSSGSQANSAQTGAPTIAAVLSGSPWAHDSAANSSYEPSGRAFNRNNSINQEDFPKLDETIQNAAKSKQEGGERAQESGAGDEPVLKPTNLGNWSARTPVQSVDEADTPEPLLSHSPAPQVYQPPHHRPNHHAVSKYPPANQHYRRQQADCRLDETKRPFLYNKNDSLIETNKENVHDTNKIDFTNLDENNWAMITYRVNYDEKLDFNDDDDDDENEQESENRSESVKTEFQVDFEEQKFEDKRKEKQEEISKNLERAKLRRDEEIKRQSQAMKSASSNEEVMSAKETKTNIYKNNHSNRTSQNSRSNNTARKNDDQIESNSRPNSRYHPPSNPSHQSHAFTETQTIDKSEKTSHYQASNNQRQNYSSQSFSQNNFQSQSNRYHQSNTSQSTKAPQSNSRYQSKKSEINPSSESRVQSEQKKSLKQLSHNVPEIESKLQPLGSKKQLPTQTNQTVGQAQAEKKTEMEPKSSSNDIQEPRQNVWNRNQNDSSQNSQTKQTQNKPEPKTKYQQRSNQSHRYPRRRYENDYEEDYEDDYDDFTEEDDEQFSQNNRNRTASGSVYSRRPNSSHYPQSYKRGSNRRSNDFYEMESKNYYSYSNRYYNYDYNYPKGYSNYNYRGNSRGSGYPTSNKIYYNSNTKNGSAKENQREKESQNRSRDQTSMTKHSEPTDGEMYDEWETASDTSLRHQTKRVEEPKPSAKDTPKAKNQPHKQLNSKRSANQRDVKSRKPPSNTNNTNNPNDPRYTAKYWSDNSKNEKTGEQQPQENKSKNNNHQKNGNNQGRVNLQVYRVDKIVADDPEAIKEALKNQNIKEKPAAKANPLSGIDLNNRAGVVIVDYIPESGEVAVNEENSADDEEKDDDDGFQKVKTKRDKKAEKLKAQAEAAAAAAALVTSTNSTKKKDSRNAKRSAAKADSKTKAKNGIMSNIQTWKNDMAKSGAKGAKSVPLNVESRTKSLSNDLNKKTNVWESNVAKNETNKVEKSIEKETKPIETAKPKEDYKEISLVKQETQPSQKNVCTVKPTKQVAQPVSVEQKPSANISASNSVNAGSNVVSPVNNQQHLNENQSVNKYYDKIIVNQATSSAAVAASAAAAAAAVVAVTVTSIQQQQIPNGEQAEQASIKQSSSSSSIKNQSSSNSSAQAEAQNQVSNNEMPQMAHNQANYNFTPANTTSQTSLMSSPSQTNSQTSASSLMHSLSISQGMQPPQFLQPVYQPMVQQFMSQSRPMLPQAQPQNQPGNTLIQNQQNKTNLNSLFDLNFGEFNGKEGMFFAHGPPHQQNYIGQMPPGPIPQAMPHLPAQPINPYPNGFDHNQFFNQKILNNKPNGAFVAPPMPSNQFNASVKAQFNQSQGNQLINPMHQYGKEFPYFNNQIGPGQTFTQTQGSNQPTPAPNSSNLSGFFMSQIGNLNANQFQAQAHGTAPAQQSLFSMNQGQLSNNQLFGLSYNQQQQQQPQNSQFNLSNLIQTPQNQPQPNQPTSHRQTPLSIPSSPFIQSETQPTENGFIKQQNSFDINYKPQQQQQQQPNQPNFARNGTNLPPNKQIFSSLDANNFDKNQLNKSLNQSNGYYRSIDQTVQNHFSQVAMIPPQQQPPLLPNPPIMHNQMPNQIQPQNINNKMGFNKAVNLPRYPNGYPNQNRQQAPATYYNQNYNRRSYPNQTNYQNNGKKMPFIDAKVVQKNSDLPKQAKQDGTQSGQSAQSQTRGSTPNITDEKNECNTNVI